MESATKHSVGIQVLITKSTVAMTPMERTQAAPVTVMIASKNELVSISIDDEATTR